MVDHEEIRRILKDHSLHLFGHEVLQLCVVNLRSEGPEGITIGGENQDINLISPSCKRVTKNHLLAYADYYIGRGYFCFIDEVNPEEIYLRAFINRKDYEVHKEKSQKEEIKNKEKRQKEKTAERNWKKFLEVLAVVKSSSDSSDNVKGIWKVIKWVFNFFK